MAKSNFIVRGGADFSNINKGLIQTQKQFSAFQSGISKSMKLVGAILGGLAIGKFVKDSTSMAMGVESSMDNIARNMSNSATVFQQWANTQSKYLGIAKAEAYSYGSTFSNLLGSFQSSTKETADSTQELMKASAIIASKTGKTYDDVANRIRSGMLGSTEAIEDLGVYTNVSMIESTNAFKKFANGKSWAQLDFKVQQQIRLAAILEQTYSRYGDTLANTTQSKQAVFLASLKNIQLNIGQVFLPIYNVALPALTTLGNALELITSKLAVLSETFFGKSISIQASGVEEGTTAIADQGDAIEKAGKQAKKSIMSFDEINQLSSNSSSSSGSGGSSSGINPTTPTATTTVTDVDTGFTKWLEKIKDVIKPTEEALGRLGEALAPLGTLVFDNIKSFYSDTLAPIGKWVLGKGLPDLLDACTNLLKKVNWNKLSTALTNFNQAIAPFAIALGTGLVKFVSNLSEVLSPIIGTTLEIVADGLNLFADAINSLSPQTVSDLGYALGSFFTSLALVSALSGVGKILSGIGTGLSGLATGMSSFGAINGFSLSIIFGSLVSDLDEWVTTTIGEKFGKVWENVLVIFANVGIGAATGFTFGNIPGAIIGGLVGGLLAAVTTLDLNGVWEALKTGMSNSLSSIFNWDQTVQLFQDMIDNFKGVLNGENIGQNLIDGLFNGVNTALSFVLEPLVNLFNAITNDVKKLFGIKSPSTVFAEIGKYLVEGLQKGIVDSWNDFILFISGLPSKIVEKFGDIKTKFTTKGANIIDGIKQGWSNNVTAFNTWLAGKPSLILTSFGNIKDKFLIKGTDIISGIKKGWTDGWNDFKTWLSNIPSLIATGIGSLKDVGKNLLNSFVEGLKSISIPKLDVSFGTTTKSILGQDISVPKLDIGWYANGGFPSAGELFVANEAGPELVGKMGNSSVVANNNQIIDGIKAGVAEGVIDALVPFMMNMGSGGGDVIVENTWMTSDEKLYQSTQRGKKKSERRFQTVNQY